MQRVKMGKKKNDQTDVKWRHSTEAVEKGKITYACKLLGSTPVTKSKGSEIIKEAIKKLQFANDIKKSEEGLKASKLKKVDLSVSVQSLLLTDTKSKTTLYSFPLQRISYCADDKSSKRLFGFIAREKESPQHHCYILESEKNAEELTLAVGQAFDLAYKKYKSSQEGSTGKKEVNQMKQRVESTEKENELLKKKLEELERSQQGTISPAAAPENSVEAGHESQSAVPDSGKPIFDPFSGSEDPAFELTNASVEDPFSLRTDLGPSETFPAGVGSNPFAAIPQDAPTTNQNDLLNMFTTENPPVTSQDEDPFDPLAQINELSSPQGNSQQEISTFPSFDGSTQGQQNQAPASVSRPKPPTLSAGLLPPPPTKQSIKAAQKEKFKSSAPTVQQDSEVSVDPFAEFGFSADQGSSSIHNQGIKDVQDGLQNNLVLF